MLGAGERGVERGRERGERDRWKNEWNIATSLSINYKCNEYISLNFIQIGALYQQVTWRMGSGWLLLCRLGSEPWASSNTPGQGWQGRLLRCSRLKQRAFLLQPNRLEGWQQEWCRRQPRPAFDWSGSTWPGQPWGSWGRQRECCWAGMGELRGGGWSRVERGRELILIKIMQ